MGPGLLGLPVRLFLATLAVLLLTAAPAVAQRNGVAAHLDLVTNGHDRVLEIWRDDATGEIALRDPAEAGQAFRVRGLELRRTGIGPDKVELGVWRFTSADRLSLAITQQPLIGVGLGQLAAALATGAAAPDPPWYDESLRAERRPDATYTILDFAGDAHAAARAAGRPIAWLGPRAAGLPLVAIQLVGGRTRGERAEPPSPYVVYGRSSDVAILDASLIALADTPPTAVALTTVSVGSKDGRQYAAALRKLRPSARFGGRRAGFMDKDLYVLMGSVIAEIFPFRLGRGRTPALARQLRLAWP